MDSKNKKDIRICIIGGGPAGMSAAMYLEKNGYDNYQIYEKDNRVGGKCLSPMMKVIDKDGKETMRSFEMGAVMGCDTYYAVHECEEFGGVTHENGPKMGRVFKNTDGSDLKSSKLALLKKLIKMKKLGKLLAKKYKGYDLNGHRGVSQGRYEGLQPKQPNEEGEGLRYVKGENPNLKDLSMTFKDFLKLNHCEDAELVWKGPFTSFGYGYFDEIPAAYVVKYLDYFTVRQFLKTGKLWTWYDGTESIWRGVNSKLKHPALLNSEVTKVERKEDKVYVTVNGKVEEFDKLIICTPLELFARYADATEEEKELFSKIVHKEYFTMAVDVEPTPEISYYYFDNMTPETLGHMMVFYHRWDNSDIKEQPVVTFTLRNHLNMEDVEFEKAKETTLKDLEISKLKVKETRRIDDWYYFPHVTSKDYADGWYEKVEALQGKKNTYFAGEVMAFGDMEETCEYSKDLIRRFFAK